jgi:hypothetical protein
VSALSEGMNAPRRRLRGTISVSFMGALEDEQFTSTASKPTATLELDPVDGEEAEEEDAEAEEDEEAVVITVEGEPPAEEAGEDAADSVAVFVVMVEFGPFPPEERFEPVEGAAATVAARVRCAPEVSRGSVVFSTGVEGRSPSTTGRQFAMALVDVDEEEGVAGGRVVEGRAGTESDTSCRSPSTEEEE